MLNYRLMGRSGLRVSDVALGTMLFGATNGWGVGAETAQELYDTFRAEGGNYLDTANQYADGESERIIGRLVAGHREEVVIASKYTNSAPRNGDANAGGNQRKNMAQSVEGSLRRLNTDYLDLYIVHSWDLLTPVDEVMRGLDDLVRAGKVLYVGVSNTPAWVVAQANTMAELRGWSRYVGVQIEYSLLGRGAEAEFFPMAQEFGLSVLAWSPLKNGLLTGKYAAGGGAGSRLSAEVWNAPAMAWSGRHGADVAAVLDALGALAVELDATPAQLALAWLRHRPVHVVPILGATSVAQLTENLRSTELELTAAQVARLDEAAAVPLAYPHPYLAGPMARSFRSAGMFDRISPARPRGATTTR
ncbi:aldo/keto reductase [Yinghuangia sp. ASG 101]|uniref:aldo/keto reductase n=1 Tax=Yinghuangia sp. ASG 101 TaxID=2896848 RepID=UPI001E4026AB|nr:aldo/keto reductase [Yinghuangia sp. ASG 101]UGQ11134.1 aldo/keto reductase [Yinghuangia sp. ASG 101]